jgi:hypothetical protein
VRPFVTSFVAIAFAGCAGEFGSRAATSDAAGEIDSGSAGLPGGAGGSAGAGTGGGGSAGRDASGAGGTGGTAGSGGGGPVGGTGGGGTGGGGTGGTTGGSGGSGGSADAGGGGTGGTGKPVFVAVGLRAYRVRSLDLGQTWIDVKTEGTSGDNEWVIRGVGFGNGLFVAARGYPSGDVRTSPDGATWTNHKAPTNQWMGGVVYVGGHFVAAGGTGTSWISPDGITWTAKTSFGNLGVRTVVAGGGVLLAAGNGEWWKSTDSGSTWTYDSAHTANNDIRVAYCGNTFVEVGVNGFQGLASCTNFTRCRGAVHAEGVYLRTNDRRIERSLNGTTWTPVHTATEGLEDVEIGYVP